MHCTCITASMLGPCTCLGVDCSTDLLKQGCQVEQQVAHLAIWASAAIYEHACVINNCASVHFPRRRRLSMCFRF